MWWCKADSIFCQGRLYEDRLSQLGVFRGLFLKLFFPLTLDCLNQISRYPMPKHHFGVPFWVTILGFIIKSTQYSVTITKLEQFITIGQVAIIRIETAGSSFS